MAPANNSRRDYQISRRRRTPANGRMRHQNGSSGTQHADDTVLQQTTRKAPHKPRRGHVTHQAPVHARKAKLAREIRRTRDDISSTDDDGGKGEQKKKSKGSREDKLSPSPFLSRINGGGKKQQQPWVGSASPITRRIASFW